MTDAHGVLSGVDLVLAIDRSGSATRAAVQLGTTTATILRQLETFEEQVGARLFDRGSRGLRPTAAMALVRPWAEQAEAAARGMLREITRTERAPEGTVRLAVPPLVASLFVVPALGRFRAQYPDIVVEVVPATAAVDLAMREADLAIRTRRPSKGDLVAQRLASFPVIAVRSPALAVARRATYKDLPWLGWDRSLAHIPEAGWIETHVPEERVVFRSSELSPLVRAAQEGLGITLMAEPIARTAGGLDALGLATPPLPVSEIFVVSHAALRPVPRVAAVWSWIIGAFADSPLEAKRSTRKASRR